MCSASRLPPASRAGHVIPAIPIPMSFSLARFGLKEMLRCGLDLRRSAGEADTLEEVAHVMKGGSARIQR